jgi:hypothetical protein
MRISCYFFSRGHNRVSGAQINDAKPVSTVDRRGSSV